jgi:nucleotide-binding universal stress UspA family protein
MKRKILVPIDFSATSYNAYCYARALAEVFGCRLELIHAYSVSYTKNTMVSLLAEEGMIKTISSKMDAFIKKAEKETEGTVLTKVNVIKKIEEAAPVPLIINESKTDDVFLIVMGTTGKHHLGDYILGSVASAVAQGSRVPVLLIPEKVAYRPFKSILYASNFEAAHRDMLREIINFANLFRAAVHFVHVKEKSSTEDFEITKEIIFNQLFKNGEPAFSFQMDVVESNSVVHGLHQYADSNQIDLIVLVNKQRGFFDSLMGSSASKNMALDLKHPLMVYHYPIEL